MNTELMKCWLLSQPEVRGFRRRLHSLWLTRNPTVPMTEGKLAGQVYALKRRGEFSILEIEELKRELGLGVHSDLASPVSEALEASVVDPLVSNSESGEQLQTSMDEEGLHQSIQNSISENHIRDAILQSMNISIGDRIMLPKLNAINKKDLQRCIGEVNEVIAEIGTDTLEATNSLVYAAAKYICEFFGLLPYRETRHQCPAWKLRLSKKLDTTRKELSQLVAISENRLQNHSTINFLNKKYRLYEENIHTVIEVMKQKVTAISHRIRRYECRFVQYRQNRLFATNPKKVFEKSESSTDVPDPKLTLEFWKSLWERTAVHKSDAEWLGTIADEVNLVQPQANLEISLEHVKLALKKMKNWKAPGCDLIQTFWWKKLNAVHERLPVQLQAVLGGCVPDWLVCGCTTLIQKAKSKGPIPSNYRPITCLPTIWKLLTSILANVVNQHLVDNNLSFGEQRGCKRGARGTMDHLCVDKAILQEVHQRKKNLETVWIDYRKAYDSVPHTWIQFCLQLFQVAKNICSFISQVMVQWHTQLFCNNHLLGTVRIQCGIFQGDSFSPLLFVLALMPLTLILRKCAGGYQLGNEHHHVNHLLYLDDLKLYGRNQQEIQSLVRTVKLFSDDISMEFGFEKCASLSIKRGKVQNQTAPCLEGILPLPEGSFYRYLGMFESNVFATDKMKSVVQQEFLKRCRVVY